MWDPLIWNQDQTGIKVSHSHVFVHGQSGWRYFLYGSNTQGLWNWYLFVCPFSKPTIHNRRCAFFCHDLQLLYTLTNVEVKWQMGKAKQWLLKYSKVSSSESILPSKKTSAGIEGQGFRWESYYFDWSQYIKSTSSFRALLGKQVKFVPLRISHFTHTTHRMWASTNLISRAPQRCRWCAIHPKKGHEIHM